MMDFRSLRGSVDLVAIASKYTDLNSSLQGPCPICRAGDDRFYIHIGLERWGCRKCCELGDDVFGLVQRVQNVDFKQAVEILTGENFSRPEYRVPVAQRKEPPKRGERWQEWAEKEVEDGIGCLLSPDGAEGRRYLKARGLGIRSLCNNYRIGFNPKQGFDWDKEAKRFREFRPAILIPWIDEGGEIQSVRYRFVDTTGDPVEDKKRRFGQKVGSNPTLFGLHRCTGTNRTLLVAEGEMNILSLALACRSVDVASLGSESNSRGVEMAARLATRYDSTLVWMDDRQRAKAVAIQIGAQYALATPFKQDANAILQQYGPAGLADLIALRMKGENAPIGNHGDTDALAAGIAKIKAHAEQFRDRPDYPALLRALGRVRDRKTAECEYLAIKTLCASVENAELAGADLHDVACYVFGGMSQSAPPHSDLWLSGYANGPENHIPEGL